MEEEQARRLVESQRAHELQQAEDKRLAEIAHEKALKDELFRAKKTSDDNTRQLIQQQVSELCHRLRAAVEVSEHEDGNGWFEKAAIKHYVIFLQSHIICSTVKLDKELRYYIGQHFLSCIAACMWRVLCNVSALCVCMSAGRNCEHYRSGWTDSGSVQFVEKEQEG